MLLQVNEISLFALTYRSLHFLYVFHAVLLMLSPDSTLFARVREPMFLTIGIRDDHFTVFQMVFSRAEAILNVTPLVRQSVYATNPLQTILRELFYAPAQLRSSDVFAYAVLS